MINFGIYIWPKSMLSVTPGKNCCIIKSMSSIIEELLAIRRIFSLVDMINNIKFSNCPNVFEIGVVWQQNMHGRQQNTFQSDSPFTIP